MAEPLHRRQLQGLQGTGAGTAAADSGVHRPLQHLAQQPAMRQLEMCTSPRYMSSTGLPLVTSVAPNPRCSPCGADLPTSNVLAHARCVLFPFAIPSTAVLLSLTGTKTSKEKKTRISNLCCETTVHRFMICERRRRRTRRERAPRTGSTQPVSLPILASLFAFPLPR